MIKQTYALRDLTTEIFLNSLNFLNDGEAIRWAQTQVDGDPTTNMVAAHPEQFVLYRLQDFNDKTGCYQSRDKEKSVKDQSDKQHPKEIIPLISLKKEKDRVFTVEELIKLLDARYNDKPLTEVN